MPLTRHLFLLPPVSGGQLRYYKLGAYNSAAIMQVSYNAAYLLGTVPGFRYNHAQWMKITT
ncbi:hypothetical protein [Morganella morganii IS15]|nr:hypothetical protein B5S45_10100 [Morganella morganii]CDK67668.1 hypothetical protein [Morganella morganii IS15]